MEIKLGEQANSLTGFLYVWHLTSETLLIDSVLIFFIYKLFISFVLASRALQLLRMFHWLFGNSIMCEIGSIMGLLKRYARFLDLFGFVWWMGDP